MGMTYRRRAAILAVFVALGVWPASAGANLIVNPGFEQPTEGEIGWDPERGELVAAQLGGLDAVVNLAGAGIGDHRWTDDFKRRIRESRVHGTSAIAAAMATIEGPRVLLNASAVGYYGNGEQPVDETAPAGGDFR